MTKALLARAVFLMALCAAIAALSAGVWHYGYRQALDQVAARGRADLALASDRLVSQLARYRDTAVLLAEHPTLRAVQAGADRAPADDLLLEVKDRTSALAVFYADATGRILAAAEGPGPVALRQAPYFRRALQGALGAAQDSSTGPQGRAYSYAAPGFGADGRVEGVLVVVVDIEKLEREWSGARPAVWFAEEDGTVFIANRDEMLGWQRVAGGFAQADGARLPVTVRRIGGRPVWHQSLSPYIPGRALYLVQPLPVIGLRGEALVDVEGARRLAWLQAASFAALCLFFGALLLVATERRRVLAEANAVLEARVSERTRDLEGANTALRREVAEREEAEAALRRAQADLVQAGKLSALGQMSAGISHELNQPLMAIRQFAENGAAFLEKGRTGAAGDNLARISALAARAARIIKNLRAFARNESEPMGRVDVAAVIDSAVELTETRLLADGVVLDWVRPAGPVWALGGEVRLAQVFVNLINNAADAMAGQAGPGQGGTGRGEAGQAGTGQGRAGQGGKRIAVTLDAGAPIVVRVRDTGPGIADPDRIFEPFYTTKQVGDGEGMGLGLSISYGLVQSFGGRIRGANVAGGAEFTVELEPFRAEVAA